jgi:hypothetical protein
LTAFGLTIDCALRIRFNTTLSLKQLDGFIAVTNAILFSDRLLLLQNSLVIVGVFLFSTRNTCFEYYGTNFIGRRSTFKTAVFLEEEKAILCFQNGIPLRYGKISR